MSEIDRSFEIGSQLRDAVNSQQLISSEIPIHPVDCKNQSSTFKTGGRARGSIRRTCPFYISENGSTNTQTKQIKLMVWSDKDGKAFLRCLQFECGSHK